jgi:hypothetical protein
VIYQIDLEKQHLDYLDIGHNYAWTNVYYVDVAGDDAAVEAMNLLADIESGVLPETTNIRFGCWRRGIGGAVPGTVQVLGVNGQLPVTGPERVFGDTALIVAYSGRRRVWYKRWRGPLRAEDVDGLVLSDTYHALLISAYINRLQSETRLVTRSGAGITSWWVFPRIAMWQRRDGSQRNVRSVLAG